MEAVLHAISYLNTLESPKRSGRTGKEETHKHQPSLPAIDCRGRYQYFTYRAGVSAFEEVFGDNNPKV